MTKTINFNINIESMGNIDTETILAEVLSWLNDMRDNQYIINKYKLDYKVIKTK